MADEKITDYTAVTSFAGDDLFEIVVDPAGTPANRKIAANLVGSGLAIVTGTDANTTMARNSHYVTDLSGWATADRDYTLPTTATIGDRIRVSALAGNASYELIVKTGTGQTCAFGGASIAAATEITRLFITGETLLFEYVASNKWMCVEDGRIPMQGWIEISTAVTTNAANTYVYATANSGAWTSKRNIGNVVDTATDKITMRRACLATIAVGMRTNSTLGDGEYVNAACELNGSAGVYPVNQFFVMGRPLGGLNGQIVGVGEYVFSAGDYVRHMFRTELANKGITNIASSMMRVYEVL